jgi:Spy/CpxP family protein refolding chaperone
MVRLYGGGLVLVLALIGAAHSQDTKVRGTLPQKWGKLGLRDDQKQAIYKIRGEYKGKIDQLQKQIDKLKHDERESMEKVLTPDQLKRLKALLTGEKTTDKPTTKPGDK